MGSQGKDAPVVSSLPKGQNLCDQLPGRVSQKETAGALYPIPETGLEWVGCEGFFERLVEASSWVSCPFVGSGPDPWAQRGEGILAAASSHPGGEIPGVCPGTQPG